MIRRLALLWLLAATLSSCGHVKVVNAEEEDLRPNIERLSEKVEVVTRALSEIRKSGALLSTRLSEIEEGLRQVSGKVEVESERLNRASREGEERTASAKRQGEALADLAKRLDALAAELPRRLEEMRSVAEKMRVDAEALAEKMRADAEALGEKIARTVDAQDARLRGVVAEAFKEFQSALLEQAEAVEKLASTLKSLGEKLAEKVDGQDEALATLLRRLETLEKRLSGKKTAR